MRHKFIVLMLNTVLRILGDAVPVMSEVRNDHRLKLVLEYLRDLKDFYESLQLKAGGYFSG